MFKRLFLFLLSTSSILYFPAQAQQMPVQQGYEDTSNTPDVQVDRSVLEELKGYQPPPMFAPSPDLGTQEIPKITPVVPAVAPLTAPKPVAEEMKTRPEKSVKKSPEPAVAKPTAQPKKAMKPVAVETKAKAKAKIKPKAKTPSMPAVPATPVQRSELPALPPTDNGTIPHKSPSIGQRLMDAALQRHIETDEDKIRETLKSQPVKQVGAKPTSSPPPTPAKTPLPEVTSNDSGLVFKAGQTDLPPDLGKKLKDKIIPLLNRNKDARIQILSFASATDGTESSARRVSLSRALAVRDFMLKNKIDAARIDVRALANQGSGAQQDKVDIVLLNR